MPMAIASPWVSDSNFSVSRKYDKKNVNGKVQFVLMQQMEKCALDVLVAPDLLLEGIDFYSKN